MMVNSTLDLLDGYVRSPEAMPSVAEKCLLLRADIIEAMKFDLGDEFSDMPGFKMSEKEIGVPKLPYDKVYFEAVSSDKQRYGAIFENVEKMAVCGQMLVEAAANNNLGKRGLFPIGLVFVQEGDRLEIYHSHDEKFKELQVGAIVALNLMVKAIAVLNCSNVKIVESPEKKWINKKREAKGKLPLFTFKTLHIDIGEQIKHEGQKIGTHASPREHLRRGHIRKLSSGKTIWVQPCVVGDKSKGMVHKDYAAFIGGSNEQDLRC